jgi:tetratricopeptide (TPR) repeat protein
MDPDPARSEDRDYRGERLARLWSDRLVGGSSTGSSTSTVSLDELIERDYSEIVEALDWCIRTEQGELGFRLADPLGLFWETHGRTREGIEWFEKLERLESAKRPTRVRSSGLYSWGMLAFREGDQASSRARFEEALRLGRDLKDPATVTRAACGLARVSLRDGAIEETRRWAREGKAAAETSAVPTLMFQPTHMLAAAARTAGEFPEAKGWYEANIRLARRLDKRSWLAVELVNLSVIKVFLGEMAGAEKLLVESLAVGRAQNDLYVLPYVLIGFGKLAVARGEWRRAAILLEAGRHHVEAKDQVLDTDEQGEYERAIGQVASNLDASLMGERASRGRGMTLDASLDYAAGTDLNADRGPG